MAGELAARAIDPRDARRRASPADGHARRASTEPWTPRRDLLGSDGDATDFVVEIEDDGRARLRFGDDAHGKRPDPGTAFDGDLPRRQRRRRQRRRRGDRPRRQHGRRRVQRACATRCRRPAASIRRTSRRRAAMRPQAFRTQERAVTAADYAAAAERRPEVQRAAATFRWTGSWHTVFVTADRVGGARGRRRASRRGCAATSSASAWPATTSRSTRRASCRSTSRCTSASRPDYFRADVLQRGATRAVERRAARRPPRRSSIPTTSRSASRSTSAASIAAAQAVEGVESVRVDGFQRLVDPSPASLDERRDRHRRPRDRPARQQSRTSPSAAGSRWRQEAANERRRCPT